jgi:hypothetical protein
MWKNTYSAIGELVVAGNSLHLVELGKVVDHRKDDNWHHIERTAAHLKTYSKFNRKDDNRHHIERTTAHMKIIVNLTGKTTMGNP